VSAREAEGEPARSAGRRAAGWAGLALLLAYTAMVHHGIGYDRGRLPPRWWHPNQFLLDTALIGGGLSDAWLQAAAALLLPALLLVLLVFVGTRSATARALSLSCVATLGIFCFYAFRARFVWEFFHWRGSLTMLLIGLAAGCALAAPLLAASWLRRHPLLQVALYLPVVLVVVAFLRNATGTDESLAFNFSPWPAVSIFGLEIAAYAAAGLHLALALAALAYAGWARRPGTSLLLLALALWALPAWLAARFGEGVLRRPRPLLLLLGLAAVAALAAVVPGGRSVQAYRRRALHCALGAALVFLPLFVGRAWSTGDYVATRFVRAQELIDALAVYYEGREEYPDSLSTLVDQGLLDSVPRPRIGFSLLADLGLTSPPRFSYRNLGSSYVLEFVSTEWVQCAYNPPWEEDEEYADEYDDEETEEAWSCPESRPELW
jgi:hypothetical protein